MDELDLSQVNNPYDFAYPVLDQTVFAGRKREIEDITYYLDQAKATLRPMSIAILGPRASGKTSLLNMSEIEAKKRHFCTARVNLDEGDSTSLLLFFFKIFDAVLYAALEKDAFGGIGSKTHDAYMEMVSAYNIPEVKTYSPFVFPMQFAKAMSTGSVNAPISDSSFQRDLSLVATELNKPMILIFDEMNVLSGSRVHLQKLRNIFMNLSGYMLILAGTPDLFPAIDEVFSPIARQFKKIVIGGFEDQNDTEACVKRPLEKLGLDPNKIIAQETLDDFRELHSLSGGNPYEIQLVCHFMFKRIQEKKAKSMSLNATIFEDVLRELESSQKLSRRQMLLNIKSLTDVQLHGMELFSASNGIHPLKNVLAIEYVFHGHSRWTEETLNTVLSELVEKQILAHEEETVDFCGDEFDKIYFKYYAREKDVTLAFSDSSLDAYWRAIFFQEFVKKYFVNIETFGSGDDPPFLKLLDQIQSNESLDQDTVNKDAYDFTRAYRAAIGSYYDEDYAIIIVRASSDWLESSSWFALYADQGFSNYLNEISSRALETGIQIEVAKLKKFETSPQKLLSLVHMINDQDTRQRALQIHMNIASKLYFKEAPRDELLFHLTILDDNGLYVSANNLGYLFLSCGDISKAESLLHKAISQADSSGIRHIEKSLPQYNLAIIRVKQNLIDEAIGLMESCLVGLETEQPTTRTCSALFHVKLNNNELVIEEARRTQDLLMTATMSLNSLKTFMSLSQA